MALRNHSASIEADDSELDSHGNGKVFRTGLATMLAGCRAHPVAAVIALVTGLTNGASMVFGAIAVGWSIDHLVLPSFAQGSIDTRAAGVAVLAVVGISGLRVATIVLRGVSTGYLQFSGEADTRRAVTRAYLRLGVAWHRRHSTGQLISNAGSDVEAAWHPMLFFPFAVGMVFMLLLALVRVARADPYLAAVALALVPVVLGANLLNQRLISPRAGRAQRLRAEVSRVAHETFEGDQVVRTLGIADAQRDRFAAEAVRLQSANTRMGHVSAGFDPVIELAPTATVLVVLLVGSHRYAGGDLTVGTLVEVCYLLLTSAIPLNVIGRFLGLVPMSVVGGWRVRSVLDSTEAPPHGALLRAGTGPVDVTLQGAGYVYPASRAGVPALAAANLRIRAGSTVAVVGATGSGKSTLLALVARLIDPSTGLVRHDGVDVRDFAEGQLPSWVAIAGQSTFLFDDTVRANVLIGRVGRVGRVGRIDLGSTQDENQDDELVWSALRIAAAEDFVRALPQGLDTPLGEGGGHLSGGQRQRLALARALARRPDLLVLDDATSALDPQVETAVIANLRGRLPGATRPTVLLTASRRSAIELADHVLYLERGVLAGDGSHAALLATRPGYRALVSAYDAVAEQPAPEWSVAEVTS
jgi:ATP-binding cassette subfamily B protein